MLDIVYGSTRDHVLVARLVQALEPLNLTGTLYIGYPIIASADDAFTTDAMLLSQEHGLVVFVLHSDRQMPNTDNAWQSVEEQQDAIYYAVKNNLGRHPTLRKGRELGVVINVVTLFPQPPEVPVGFNAFVSDIPHLGELLQQLDPVPAELFRPLSAALQRVTAIKPVKKRTAAVTPGSRGAVLKRIEREIANLDQWQKAAAIETPDGPQRVRGLAGSGKTIVLALKAAYLHAQHPDWTIAVTFHSRALYQQFTDLVRRFSFEHQNDEPNWDRLRILHAWGGVARSGVYTEMAAALGATPRDFLYAKAAYGMDAAFQGVLNELLAIAEQQPPKPIYDAVLVDEAQDLPKEFFRLIHLFTQEPKRIVWAYDELQNLSQTSMPSVRDLFGLDEHGEPRVTLANNDGQPRQDIVLPVCYRNTPWALTLAHAIGFGIFRKGGLVQHFDDPALWTDIGYRVLDGELSPGQRVVLERNPSSFPSYFPELLTPADAVSTHRFDSETAQDEWVATQVAAHLKRDELEMDDILLILPDVLTAKKKARSVQAALARHGIDSHVAGVTSSTDEMFSTVSVAITNIYRAKGNEAPMVYVLNSQHCYAGYELIKLRNTLFTAITRSRAWVRLCGWGEEMSNLEAEIRSVQQHRWRLEFTIPTQAQLAKMRKINRDLTAGERAKIDKLEKNAEELIKALERGELSTDALPPKIRRQLAEYFSGEGRAEHEAEEP